MTGYVRQDTANLLSNGNVVDADIFDAEYDALANAFDTSTGHSHNGQSGEGAAILVVGPAQEYVANSSEFKPKQNNTYDLGSTSAQWKDLYIDGVAYIDSVDIDAGSIDGTAIGANTASTGSFTTVTTTGNTTIGGTFGVTGVTTLGTANITTATLTSADINGGTIDATVVGGTTPAAGTFTTVTVNGDITVTGTVDGRDVAADGTKLDGIASGAEVNQNTFATIAVSGQSNVVADAKTDTLTLAAGTGVGITTDASTDTVTFTNTAPDQTVVLTAGTGISTGGTYPNLSITNTAPDQVVALTGSGATSISGTYPNFTISSTDTNTTYTAGSGLSLVSTTFSHADTSSVSNLDTSGAQVIDVLGFDTFGHVTSVSTRNLTVSDLGVTASTTELNYSVDLTGNIQTQLDAKALQTTTITAGTGLTGGGDLSTNRTISPDIASQAEAEAGTATNKLMTPQRTAQAIAALAPSAGAMDYLGKVQSAGISGITFSQFNNSTYSSYMFVLTNVIPFVDGATLLMRTSSDGGVSYDDDATDYTFTVQNFAQTGGSLTTDPTESFITLFGHQAGANAGEDGVSGTLIVTGAGDASRRTTITGTFGGFRSSDGAYVSSFVAGARNTATIVNAVRFYFSSSFMVGTIEMYGLRTS